MARKLHAALRNKAESSRVQVGPDLVLHKILAAPNWRELNGVRIRHDVLCH
jgi:hypothetical protein